MSAKKKKNIDAAEEGAVNEAREEGAVKRVGKAAGLAGLQLFTALITAGDSIVEETIEETAAVVGHRYGQEAGDAARDGLEVARDVNKVKNMVGKRAVVRMGQKAALYTARGLVEGAVTNGTLTSANNTMAPTSTPSKNNKVV